MSPKIIKKGSFDTSQIKKFDSELAPRKITEKDSSHIGTPKFEKNVHHAEKVMIFKDAENEAHTIVEEARKKALAEADKIKKDAFNKGYQDGLAQAVSEGKTYVSDAVGSFTNLLNELTSYKHSQMKEAEKQLLKLAVEIAHKVILRKIEEDDEIILDVTKQALNNLIDREKFTIRLNPKDVEIMKREKVRLMQEVDGIKKMTLIEDESIVRGGCYIETDSSEVDARIDKQLEIIDKTLERK